MSNMYERFSVAKADESLLPLREALVRVFRDVKEESSLHNEYSISRDLEEIHEIAVRADKAIDCLLGAFEELSICVEFYDSVVNMSRVYLYDHEIVIDDEIEVKPKPKKPVLVFEKESISDALDFARSYKLGENQSLYVYNGTELYSHRFYMSPCVSVL